MDRSIFGKRSSSGKWGSTAEEERRERARRSDWVNLAMSTMSERESGVGLGDRWEMVAGVAAIVTMVIVVELVATAGGGGGGGGWWW